MSDNRDIGWDVQQEEKVPKQAEDEEVNPDGEETAKDDSSSSKTPMQTATTDHTQYEEDAIPLPSSAMPQLELGDSFRSRRPGKEAEEGETSDVNQISHSPSFTTRKFLFKMRVTHRDVARKRLFVPVQIGLDHFPHPLAKGQPYQVNIKICDLQNHKWDMTKTYDRFGCGFVINSEWAKFLDSNKLKAKDVLSFYKPSSNAEDNHYLIIVGKPDRTLPQFKLENFLFQKELTCMDVMLSLSREEVRTYFPDVRIPAATHMMERLCFTDAQNKDWHVGIKFYNDYYGLPYGWGEYVEEHKLEIGDVIKFYKPVNPFDSHHFLIQHVKRGEAAGTNEPAEPGGTGSAGNESSGQHIGKRW